MNGPTKTNLTKLACLDSVGDIHFWIYYDVTDNCILDLQRKISIRNAFAPLLSWFLSCSKYAMRPRDILKGTSEEHGRQLRKMACVSATQRKIQVTWIQRLCFWCVLSGNVWILANFRYVIIFLVLKKLLRDTRVNLLVFCSNKIDMHDTLVHMHGLWKSVKWVISAPLMVHCVSVSWIVF